MVHRCLIIGKGHSSIITGVLSQTFGRPLLTASPYCDTLLRQGIRGDGRASDPVAAKSPAATFSVKELHVIGLRHYPLELFY